MAWLLLLDYGNLAPGKLATDMFPNLNLDGKLFDSFVTTVNNKRQSISRDFKDICCKLLGKNKGVSIFPAFEPRLAKSLTAVDAAPSDTDSSKNWITKTTEGARCMTAEEIETFQSAIVGALGEVCASVLCTLYHKAADHVA